MQRDRARGPSPHNRQAEEQGLLGEQRRNLWGVGGVVVLALILRKPGKLGLVSWNRELSGSGRDTRSHRVRNGWMGGKEEETVRFNSR